MPINLDGKKIIIWGVTGAYYGNIDKLNYKAVYLVDSNPKKQNTYIDGEIVLPPGKLAEEEKDKTFVLVFSEAFYGDIREQLESYGYQEYQNFCCFTDVIKTDYQKWIEKYEPKEADLKEQVKISETFKYKPLISILVPTYETDKTMLIEMIQSVINQTYSNWELCIADGASKQLHVREVLSEFSKQDPGIKYVILDENKGIIGNSQEALKLCQGDYIGLLDHDDLLAPHALFEVVKIINEENSDFIYSDEDKISADSLRRFGPHFKPEWSPDTLRSYNYITHFVVLKHSLLNEIGGFREGFEGSQDHDLILRATSKAKKTSHIPQILYHWRVHNLSVAGNPSSKSYAFDSGKKAVLQQITEKSIQGTAEDGLFLGGYRLRYSIINRPDVGIIIESNGLPSVTGQCIASINRETTYERFRILVIVRSDEDERYFALKDYQNVDILRFEDPNKAQYKQILEDKETDYYILLDNRLRVITGDWIESLLEHAQRTEVGVVGCRILNCDGTLHHAGLVLGMNGGIGYVCRNLTTEEMDYSFYCKHLVYAVRNVSAVCGCQMVEKEKLFRYGAFNQKANLNGYDIELCLRMLRNGFLNVYTPYAQLQLIDGFTKYSTADNETLLSLRKNFTDYFLKDPYYNPNLDLTSTTPRVKT